MWQQRGMILSSRFKWNSEDDDDGDDDGDDDDSDNDGDDGERGKW